jgi:outer membrane protein assembly factor BamD (BamD/ComL family)
LCPQKDRQTSHRREAHFLDADKNLNENRFNEALYKFEKFISKYPNSTRISDAYYRVGYISVILEKYDRAIEVFSFYSKNYPDGQFSVMVDTWVQLLKRLTPKKLTESPQKTKKEKIDSKMEKSLEDCREENQQLKNRISKLESIIQGDKP